MSSSTPSSSSSSRRRRKYSSMDSIYSIVFGLALRSVVGLASRQDWKVAAPVVGLWEGVITLHFIKMMPSSFDPYISWAVRMFIDYLVTESVSRMVLVIIWTCLGMALADVAPSIWFDAGLHRPWRRVRRDMYTIYKMTPKVLPRTRVVRFSHSRHSIIDTPMTFPEIDISERTTVISDTNPPASPRMERTKTSSSSRRKVAKSSGYSTSASVSEVGSATPLSRPSASTAAPTPILRTTRAVVYHEPAYDTDDSRSFISEERDKDSVSSGRSSSSSSPPGSTHATPHREEWDLESSIESAPEIDVEELATAAQVEATQVKKDEDESTPRAHPMYLPPTPSDSAARWDLSVADKDILVPPPSAFLQQIPDDNQDYDHVAPALSVLSKVTEEPALKGPSPPPKTDINLPENYRKSSRTPMSTNSLGLETPEETPMVERGPSAANTASTRVGGLQNDWAATPRTDLKSTLAVPAGPSSAIPQPPAFTANLVNLTLDTSPPPSSTATPNANGYATAISPAASADEDDMYLDEATSNSLREQFEREMVAQKEQASLDYAKLLEERQKEEEEARARIDEKKRQLEEERQRYEDEQQRLAAEMRRQEEEKARIEAERRKQEEERSRLEEERTRQEEERSRLEAEAKQQEAERLRLEDERRRFEEEARLRAQQEEEERRKLEEKRIAEEADRLAQAVAREAAEEEARRVAAEEEARRVAAEEEAARLAAEEAERFAAEEEVKRLAEEAELARIAADQEAKWLVEETEAKRLAEEAAAEAARLKAEEEEAAARLAAEEEAARLAVEEAARLAAEVEAARLKAEEEAAQLKAEGEAARLAREEEEEAARLAAAEEAKRVGDEAEAKRLAEEEEAERTRLAEEEAERTRLAEEEERTRLAEEEVERARLAEEAELTRLAEEEAERVRLAEEEAERVRLAEEAEEKRLAAEEEAKRVAEEAEAQRVAAEEAERLRLAEEAKRIAEEADAEAQRLAAKEAERTRLAEEESEMIRLAGEEAEKQRLAQEEEARQLAEAEASKALADADEEKKRKKEERKAKKAKKEEKKRKAEEEAEAAKLKAEEEEAAEQQRVADEAEQNRLADEAAEQERLANEAAAAEQQRLADEAAEQQRLAEEAAQQKLAEEAEQERLVQEAAEAEAEAARVKEQEDEAERQRQQAAAELAAAAAAEEAQRAEVEQLQQQQEAAAREAEALAAVIPEQQSGTRTPAGEPGTPTPITVQIATPTAQNVDLAPEERDADAAGEEDGGEFDDGGSAIGSVITVTTQYTEVGIDIEKRLLKSVLRRAQKLELQEQLNVMKTTPETDPAVLARTEKVLGKYQKKIQKLYEDSTEMATYWRHHEDSYTLKMTPIPEALDRTREALLWHLTPDCKSFKFMFTLPSGKGKAVQRIKEAVLLLLRDELNIEPTPDPNNGKILTIEITPTEFEEWVFDFRQRSVRTSD